MQPDWRSWDEAVPLLAEATGAVLILGAIDTGKTTLATQAANEALARGRAVALVDGDMGQSELGPPGTIGLARPEAPFTAPSELRTRALAFVGDTTPAGHLLAVVSGIECLARHARTRGAELILIDTAGLVRGRLAEKLQVATALAVRPALVVGLARGGESDRLIALVAAATGAATLRVRTPDSVAYKTPLYRRARRAKRWAAWFESARPIEVAAAQLLAFDGWPFTGTPLAPGVLRQAAATFGCDVYYGEESADGLYFCVEAVPAPRQVAALREVLRQRIVVTPAEWFRYLLVGAVREDGRVAALALLQGINFERRVYSLLTPAASLAGARLLHFGRLRAMPDGSELGRLRPGDL